MFIQYHQKEEKIIKKIQCNDVFKQYIKESSEDII